MNVVCGGVVAPPRKNVELPCRIRLIRRRIRLFRRKIEAVPEDRATELYLDLMKRCVSGWIYADEELRRTPDFTSRPGRIFAHRG